MMSNEVERRPVCRWCPIPLTGIVWPDDLEVIRAKLRPEVFQAYRVERFDQPGQLYYAFYQPTAHVLILAGNSGVVSAADVPSMPQGLGWWIQAPDVWKTHIIKTEEKEEGRMKGLKTFVIRENGSELNLISEKYLNVFVTGLDMLDNDQLEENGENLPVLVLKRHDGLLRVEPMEPPTEGNYGWFPSGNFVELEIGGEQKKIEIYDRQETPEQYAFFSS